MKLTTAKTLRHGPSPYEQYTEKNPELTRIKAAENFTRINGMMDFYKRTSRIVIAAAGLLLVVSLVVLSGIGFRTITRSPANRSAFSSSVDEMLKKDSAITQVQMMNYSSYYVYLDDSVWYGLTKSEKSDYCTQLADAMNEKCHSYNILGRKETARLYFYDSSGSLVAQPSEDGLENVILR
ncbi:hypothetical protein [Enterocloster citroniae]|uniref:hypothetical protein n=1 Tax=Enterocloster citroniae TaxID=358743 RepID=UPI00349E74E1